MKSTGRVRKLDELGRIVIPMEIRNTFDINSRDALEIFTEDDRIVLKKYEPCCIFCGSPKDNILYNDKRICKDCANKIKESLN